MVRRREGRSSKHESLLVTIYVVVTSAVLSFSCDEGEADGLDILMEAPEGFRNSDEDGFSESQVNRLML